MKRHYYNLSCLQRLSQDLITNASVGFCCPFWVNFLSPSEVVQLLYHILSMRCIFLRYVFPGLSYSRSGSSVILSPGDTSLHRTAQNHTAPSDNTCHPGQPGDAIAAMDPSDTLNFDNIDSTPSAYRRLNDKDPRSSIR